MLAKFVVAWLAVVVICTGTACAAVMPPPIFVGGRFIREHAVEDPAGHVLVPVRGVFEAFSASVTYTAPRIVVVRKNGMVVAGLVIGRHHAVVGNRARYLAAAPVRLKGKIYVPLRDIAEIAGASVVYLHRPRLVDIHLPQSDLLSARPAPTDRVPPDPSTPPWAYALIGLSVAGFLVEAARRVGSMRALRHLGAGRRAVPLISGALQFPNAVDSREHHGIGQVGK